MAIQLRSSSFFVIFLTILCFISCLPSICTLSSTISISHTSNHTLICGLVQTSTQQSSLNCTSFPEGIRIPVNTINTSFSAIVGGDGFLCGLISPLSAPSFSSSVVVCWRFLSNGVNMSYKRIYSGPALNEFSAGNSHVCGLVNGTNRLECWQWQEFNDGTTEFISSVAVGENFVCGLLEFGQIKCIRSSSTSVETANVPGGNYSVLAAGPRHACAISSSGDLECWGETDGEKPVGVFTSLALGDNRSCAMRPNGTVVCWGESNFSLPQIVQQTSFQAIEVKRKVFCGVLSYNLSLFCWGNDILDSDPYVLEKVVPGPCTNQCPCSSPLPDYGSFCGRGLMICQPCHTSPVESPPPSPVLESPPPTGQRQRKSDGWSDKMIAFLVVGCVGSLALVVIACFLFFRYFSFRGCRVHDSGRLDEAGQPVEQGGQPSQRTPPPPPVLEKRLSKLISMGNGPKLEEFSLQMLIEATKNFSEDHKIGTGSFGSVYHATLDDGREVAIKRAELASSSSYAGGTKRQEDNDNAFLNELEFLSRLNHKNLVELVGFCEDSNELVLVYEYMKNGSLHDHLHRFQNSPLSSWAARIKVALDAARGIEYLHVYAVPPVIHRDIKSSNILLDDTWTAKVADFGLSLMGPPDDTSHLSLRAAGTVGYMDPEYFRLQQLTSKSDVYSFGVVLLELLSGYKAIHRNEEEVPRNVVDFVVPYIVQDQIHRILDPTIPPPTPFEIEGVAYVGYLAADCVTLEGKDRPTMIEIVNSLERALAACLASPSLSRSTTRSSM